MLKITFHTLRHWKATMEYHRTKDILYVTRLLGHRNIRNTLLYTQLIKQDEDEEYISKVAKTVEEARMLVEAGFEYICDIEGVKLFRKRKQFVAGLCQNDGLVPRAGFEPATNGDITRKSPSFFYVFMGLGSVPLRFLLRHQSIYRFLSHHSNPEK